MRWLFGEDVGKSGIAGILLIIAFGFVHLLLIRAANFWLFANAANFLPLTFAVGLAVACLFARFRAGDLPEMPRLFMRGFAIIVLAYALLEPFDFPIQDPSLWSWADDWLGASRLVAIASAILAWWRPSFLLPALLYGATGRALMAAITGMPPSQTDFANVLDAGLFASSLAFSVPVARWIATRHGGERSPPAEWLGHGAKLVIAAAIGGHLGSYFWSGIAKLRLDGGPLSWILDNRTQDGILIGIERGAYPFAAFPGLAQLSYDLIAWSAVPGNTVVVLFQLAALAAMLRRRLLMGLTLVYDLLHLGIYLIYGLLFWKWVLLNLVIFATFARCRERFTPAFILTGILMTVFGHHAVWTARLAWYDSASLLSTYVEAVKSDGMTVRMPSAAFGTLSYPMSHGLAYIPEDMDGHFPALRWGSYFNHDATVASRRCETVSGYDPLPNGAGSLENLGRIVEERHLQLLGRADKHGRVNIYRYPHHHYPSPFGHRAFGALDLRQVVRHRWVLESLCLTMDGGRLRRRVIRRNVYDLDGGPARGRSD